MNRKRNLVLGLALLVTIVSVGASEETATVDACVQARRLADAVRVHAALPHPTADEDYLAGFALMELHRPLEAEAPLRAAKEKGHAAWPGWATVDALLDRVAVVRSLAPPSWKPAPPAKIDDAVDVHAGPPTDWSGPVLRALPEFAAVGRSIFGADLPKTRFDLFANRPSYDRYFGAMFGMPATTVWQDGTGNTNVVVFCEVDRRWKASRPAGAPETIGCVLHEFGHAWCGTYFMDHFGREWLAPATRRQWLDEGLADVVASLREPAFLGRRRAWVAQKAGSSAAARPTFESVTSISGFYQGDVEVHYWLAALLVAELVGPPETAPKSIRKLLDAIGTSTDVEQAVRDATGKDPKKTFESLVAKYW